MRWARLLKLKRCPWSQIEPEASVAIVWHRRYTRLRVLPFGGTDLMDQPAYVHEAICAVDDAMLEAQADHARMQREAEENARSEAEAKQKREQRERDRRK